MRCSATRCYADTPAEAIARRPQRRPSPRQAAPAIFHGQCGLRSQHSLSEGVRGLVLLQLTRGERPAIVAHADIDPVAVGRAHERMLEDLPLAPWRRA
jgi:hypothetical protein